jgi:3-oxoacyl-[acyl-carrier protein] reductase
MDLGLKGKTAIVSGGSKGLGRAIAEELALEGARVVIAARSAGPLDKAVAGIRAKGGEVSGVIADMANEQAVNAAVAFATATYDAPAIAIANLDTPDARPGGSFSVGLEDASNADFRDAYETLVMSIVHLARAVLPTMKERGWGRIVNVGSKSMKAPHAPPTQKILSNVGRLGVVGLMKTLSFEYGKYGITANIAATGQFATDLARDAYAARGTTIEAYEEQVMKPTGLGVCRFGRPEEMAALVAFLCSTRASFVSGETITITGGMHKSIF